VTRARLGALTVLVVVIGAIGSCSSGCDCGPPLAARPDREAAPEVLLFRLPPMSFEQALAVPQIRALARAGGAALLAGGTDGASLRASVAGADTYILTQPASQLGRAIEARVADAEARPILVVVTSLAPTPAMEAAKDELHPVVMARGSPDALFPDVGRAWSLTSDSTRRSGVVVASDVIATIGAFLGRPRATSGRPIHVDDAEAPFSLHVRYLEQRRLTVPLGTAAALYVVLAGLAAAVAAALRGRIDGRIRRALGWAALAVPALAVALLAVGHLADLSYASVVPFVLLVAVLGTLAFSPLERTDLTLVPAGIGVVVLAFFAVEAMLGWTAMLTPLLGGSELDGGRFYGLPNVAVGLLIGASVWVAQRLSTNAGTVVIVLVGLFAGLPLVGANLGAGVSLFATAGLWFAVRERARIGLARGSMFALGVTVVGVVVLLVAHAVSPVATHVTAFERSSGGVAGVAGKLWSRLEVGFDLIARSPAAIIPVVGLPVALLVAWRAPGAIGSAFRRWPAWRDATLVILLGGIVAYLANDSGPAAAGLAFGLGLGGMLGVSLLAPPGKMTSDG
jgi:hypothetical protein